MHVILTGIGSRGDIFPYLGFGRGLMARGHSVTMITSGNYESVVRGAGLNYIELCDGPTYLEIERVSEELGSGAMGAKAWRRENFDDRSLKLMDIVLDLAPGRLYDLMAEASVPGDTVIATAGLFDLGAGDLAREKLGVAHVCLCVNTGWFWAVQHSLPVLPGAFQDFVKNTALNSVWVTADIKKRYNALREKLGLPPKKNLVKALWRSEQLNVGLIPRWFMKGFPTRTNQTLLTDFSLYEAGQDDVLAPELEEFLSRGAPPVVFMNASWRTHLDEYFEASAEACRAEGVRAVLILGGGREPPSVTSPMVTSVPYAPLHLLLPRSAGLVSHGGIGTVARAMKEGVPQITVPFPGEQAYNARTLVRLGVGLKLSPEPKKYAEEIRPALRTLITDGRFQENSKIVAKRFPEKPNLLEAYVAMEKLVEESRKALRSGGKVSPAG